MLSVEFFSSVKIINNPRRFMRLYANCERFKTPKFLVPSTSHMDINCFPDLGQILGHSLIFLLNCRTASYKIRGQISRVKPDIDIQKQDSMKPMLFLQCLLSAFLGQGNDAVEQDHGQLLPEGHSVDPLLQKAPLQCLHLLQLGTFVSSLKQGL